MLDMMSASSLNVDIMEDLLDLTEYDTVRSNSPSLSPALTSKSTFSPISSVITTPSLPTTTQTLSGPSHNYGMYRQQTGFVPGALTDTMAVNQANNAGYQDFGNLDYISTMGHENDIFDFNATPSQGTMGTSDIDMDFNSPSETSEMFATIDPSNIEQDATLSTSAVMQTNVGRLYPGAHSARAAQAQQRQQQQMMPPQFQRQSPQQQKSRNKSTLPTDPIVQQKIAQVLSNMRAKPSSPDDKVNQSNSILTRTKKEDEDMDEDERLLASEEGKKLSSKERRQLRNKVSARAFRSRRKEYITQLEAEITTKVNENGELKAANRDLMEENKRLADLTRMLLSSPAFSTFLDDMSSNPREIPVQIKQEPQQPSQQQQPQQIPKDVNPYGAQQSQHQIGMAMIPEQNIDFSMLNMDVTYNFHPQVFMLNTPEMPAIDTSILSGKTSNFVEPLLESDDEKMGVSVIERPVEISERVKTVQLSSVDEDFENNPEFALYHSEPTISREPLMELDTNSFSHVDIFGGISTDKVLARYDLIDASEEEAASALSMARIQRLSNSIESMVSRLELLTMNL